MKLELVRGVFSEEFTAGITLNFLYELRKMCSVHLIEEITNWVEAVEQTDRTDTLAVKMKEVVYPMVLGAFDNEIKTERLIRTIPKDLDIRKMSGVLHNLIRYVNKDSKWLGEVFEDRTLIRSYPPRKKELLNNFIKVVRSIDSSESDDLFAIKTESRVMGNKHLFIDTEVKDSLTKIGYLYLNYWKIFSLTQMYKGLVYESTTSNRLARICNDVDAPLSWYPRGEAE